MSQSSTSARKLRQVALAARRAMTVDERRDASARICERLLRRHEFFAAESIACYLPMSDEVDPRRVIARAWRARKRIFCPVVDRRGGMRFLRLGPDTLLEKNRYDLWEPVTGEEIAAQDLDLVITPLVAFDEQRNRIGMGGGFYDRCFSFLKPRRYWLRPKLLGIAYDCQKVKRIEPSPWDVPLYRVISETE